MGMTGGGRIEGRGRKRRLEGGREWKRKEKEEEEEQIRRGEE